MSKQRICRKCRTRLEEDQEICPSCHASNPVVNPWYTYLVGGLIVAALAWALIDFQFLGEMLNRWL